MFRIFLILLAFVPAAAWADLGDTLESSRVIYGEPAATGDTRILAYVHGKYRIWQTYSTEGVCIIAEYSLLDPGSLTPGELRELDRNNLPGLLPGVGPGWVVVSWPDTSGCRDTLSFQYTMPSPGGTAYYQVITGQDRRDGTWRYSRMYLSDAGIAFLKSLREGGR